MIAKATLHGNAEAGRALERFYTGYRAPVLAFLRWKGVPETHVEDLTQDFFVHLMNHSSLRQYDRAKGRFRTFLSASLVNFITSDGRRKHAAKRGGGAEMLSLDSEDGDKVMAMATVAAADAEVLDRQWAWEVMHRALASARQQWVQAGKAARYDALRDFLPGSAEVPSTAEAAQRLGLSEVAVRAELSRLRTTIRQALREEIAATVSSAQEIDAECAHLRAVLHKAPPPRELGVRDPRPAHDPVP